MENSTKRKDKNKPNKKNKKNKKKKIVLLSILLVLLFIIASVGGYAFTQLSKVNRKQLSNNDNDLGIKSDVKKCLNELDSGNNITNIALFGVDYREKGENGRSDSIIIASIDKKHKKIKLSSIMRDSYVDVPGHGKTKITHAYAYGGPQLAIKTLNQDFDLDIRDYVTVDFFSLEKLINAVGGVPMDVRKDEIKYVNEGVHEQSYYAKDNYEPKLTSSGMQNLNGRQAVAYARIRNTGNGDFERTDRQRKVLNEVFKKIESAGASKYPQIVTQLLPFVETNMSQVDIVKLGTSVFLSGIKTIDQERFPVDGYCDAKTIDGVWYLVPDIKATVDQMTKYIFEDVRPTPGTPKF